MYDLKVKTITGTEKSLSEYQGKTLLIVNTASACGFTPQLGKLEQLSQRYGRRGLVLGFPSNDFGAQEPGSNAEIQQFCTLRYRTGFELFEKAPVKGPQAQPLFKHLAAAAGEPTWNFNKYLVAPSGDVVTRFESDVEPLSAGLLKQLEAVLPPA